MSRIAELRKKYPSMHKDVIAKWEMKVRGVRDSKDLDKASYWRGAHGGYLSFDEDMTLQRLKEETPWRVKDNAFLAPDRLFLRSGLNFQLLRKERSPYAIREISEGKLAIFEGEEMVDVEVYASPRGKQWQGPALVTSKGTPVGNFVKLFGACYYVSPIKFCEYFQDGDACKFCNFNATQDDGRAIGINRPITPNLEETAEAFKLLGSEVRLVDGVIVGGGLRKSETEARFHVKYVEKLNGSLPYRTYMKVHCQAMPRRELQRLKDAGLPGIRLHMETFDERLFPLMLPGKAKHLSRDGWLEAFQDAVDIFGVGNVSAKFVGGLTMQGPDGYKTWQEARDSHVEGDRWMISHGVLPTMGALWWAPGSPLSKDPANRDKFPPTEFYMDAIVAHHAAMNEYGLYERLNKHCVCGMCHGQHVYFGEMGILEKAGDVGTWMSEVVPYEQNTIAQFIDSIKS